MWESEPIPMERLPPGFAERIEDPPEPPAPARPAATVVLLRDGPEGPEALLVQRSRRLGFVPGAYVFPGGRVDVADGAPALLDRVEGLTVEGARRRFGAVGSAGRLEAEESAGRLEGAGSAGSLGHAAAGGGATPGRAATPGAGGLPPPIPPHAYYVAALREAFEETGILLGRGGSGAARPPLLRETQAARSALHDGPTAFLDVLERFDFRLDATRTEYIAHWITPLAERRRLDTRFFAAAVPDGARAVPDEGEIVDALWLTPAAALEAQRSGKVPMIFPTLHTLQALTGFDSVDALLGSYAGREVPSILPRLVRGPHGVFTQID